MARKRFNAQERAIIADGGMVEWQNVTQWHAATLQSSEIHTEDGWQHVLATNEETTRTIGKGQTIWVSPGHIRRRRV